MVSSFTLSNCEKICLLKYYLVYVKHNHNRMAFEDKILSNAKVIIVQDLCVFFKFALDTLIVYYRRLSLLFLFNLGVHSQHMILNNHFSLF